MAYRFLLIFTLCSYYFNSLAINIIPRDNLKRRPSNIDSQVNVFNNYLSCSNLLKAKKLEKFKKCVTKYVDPSLEEHYLYKFKEFLFLDNNVSLSFRCDQETVDFYEAKKSPPKYFVCFEVRESDINSIGTAFFVKKKDKYYLRKIKY